VKRCHRAKKPISSYSSAVAGDGIVTMTACPVKTFVPVGSAFSCSRPTRGGKIMPNYDYEDDFERVAQEFADDIVEYVEDVVGSPEEASALLTLLLAKINESLGKVDWANAISASKRRAEMLRKRDFPNPPPNVDDVFGSAEVDDEDN
jgi:hypothetical protein